MSQAQIGNLQVALGINTAQFAAGLSQAQGSLATFGKGLKTFAASAGAALSLGALGMAVKSNIDRMDALGKAAQKIGIPVEELSKLEYAAKLADVNLDSLASTMTRFSKNVAEVAGGGENDAGLALNAIGVSAVDAQGKLRPTVDVLIEIADKLSVMKDGAGKTALMLAMFGKSGADLIPLMNGGGAAIRAAGQDLQKFGGVVTEEATARAQDFNDRLTDLQVALTGLMQQALIPILPHITNFTRAIVEMAKTGSDVRKFIDDVAAWLDEWGPSLANTRREIEGITEALRYLGLIEQAPFEININGGNEAQGPAPPKQTKDAPILPDLTASKKAADEAADALERLKSEGQSLWESTRTPLESYQLGIRNLNGLLQQGVIDNDTYDRAVKQLQEEFSAAVPAADEFGTALMSIGQTIMDTLGSAIEGLISGTMSLKDAFKSMTASVAQQLSQLAAQLVKSSIFKLLGMLAGGFAGGGGAGINVGGMTFGGLFADGGHLGSGKWGIAGEAGPEVIHGPANITPMSSASAPQMNVTVINNSSASVNTRKNSKGELEVMVEDMLAEKLIRGGNKIDAALARGYGLRRAGRS